MAGNGPGDELSAGLGRRAVLQTLLTGAGAGIAIPALALEHPMHEHLRDQARVTAAEQKVKASAQAPQFLNAHQLQTLTLLAEQIVPGSTKAASAPFIDSLLSVETDARQRRFVEALSAFDGMAMVKAKTSWKALSETDRVALLTTASTATAGAAPAGPAVPGTAPKPQGDVTLTARDHFEHLKGWISGAYYSSEIGMRELGWTGSMFFEKFTGCTHGSH